MYHHNMIRIYRSPDAGEGGGAAAPEAGAAGAAAPGAAGNTSGEAAAPQYVAKADFDSFANEIRQGFSRFSRQPEPAKADGNEKKGERERPDPSKYDFKNDPKALQRYEDDLDEYRYETRKKREQEESQKNERETSLKKNEQGHRQRLADYRKENPDFDADAKKAGNILVLDDVKRAIFGSKNSAAVQHYLFKNPGAAEELNLMAESEGLESVRERIGEYAYAMRQQKDKNESTERAAAVRPPRQSFRGSSANGERKLSIEERYNRSQS